MSRGRRPAVEKRASRPANKQVEEGAVALHKGGYRSVKDIDEIVAEAAGTKFPAPSHECAALIEYYTRVGKAENWREGIKVAGNHVKKGTAIATFVGGVYENLEHGNHVAFYKDQDEKHLVVVDQWEGKPPSERNIPWDGMYPGEGGGKAVYKGRSNEGNAFSVIELKGR